MLERIINSIRKHSPGTLIGFVNHPEDSAKTVARVLSCDDEQAEPFDRVAHVLSLMKKGDDAFNRQDIAAMNAAHHSGIIAPVTGNE